MDSRSPQGRFDWWRALERVLSSIEAVRDGRAMYVLLASFSGAGLAVATAQASLGREELVWAVFQGAAALFIAFYGSNTAGLLLMDRARGAPWRPVMDVVEDALGVGHRVLLALAVVLLAAAAVLAALLGLFWLCDLPVVGPWLYGLVVPVTVVVLGMLFLVGAAVVGPLTGPTVWSGASSWQAVVHARAPAASGGADGGAESGHRSGWRRCEFCGVHGRTADGRGVGMAVGSGCSS